MLEHFQKTLLEDWKSQLKRTPVCPYRDCIATFTGMEELRDHFEKKHGNINVDGGDDSQFKLEDCVKKCQICLVGPFQNFEDLLFHSATKHSTIGKFQLSQLFLKNRLKLMSHREKKTFSRF